MKFEKITHSHTTTNSTSRFLVVANYHVVISNHATAEEANAALDALAPGLDGLAATPWAVAEVLAPGESTSGKLEQTIEVEGGREWTIKDNLDLFGCN